MEWGANGTAYVLHLHETEWKGMSHLMDDYLVFCPVADVPRNGEPAAPMSHVIVLPDKVEDFAVQAWWYVSAEHTHPDWPKRWGLTQVQWGAMLDLCKLFLKAYEHVRKQEGK